MMRNIYKSVMKVASVLLAALVLTACSDDSSDGNTSLMTNFSTYLQVKVQVASGSDTRADGPNGGEDGDGREDGINHENEVNNVMLLLYTAADGINAADADATITHIIYFPSVTVGTGNYYITPTQKVDGLNTLTSYHAIVVANAGDLTTDLTDKTLSEVRDYLLTTAWNTSTTIANYNNFVMSSESDATLDFENNAGTGKETNPYTMTVDIERVAARIDFNVDGGEEYTSSSTFAGYVYPVYKDATDTSVKGYLLLTHVMPFNELSSSSYLIKRVADADGTTNLSYLGDETMDASYVATNYVVDPYWSNKASATYTRPYATAAAAKEATEYGDWGIQQAKYTDTDGDDYYILDYTLENTTSDNSTTYATGLYFRGTYYTTAEWNNGSPAADTGVTRSYAYYLRHSDPTGTGTVSDPMHYGVVRNNIYRVSIDRVIEADEPGMTLTINVRKWTYYIHSEIVM